MAEKAKVDDVLELYKQHRELLILEESNAGGTEVYEIARSGLEVSIKGSLQDPTIRSDVTSALSLVEKVKQSGNSFNINRRTILIAKLGLAFLSRNNETTPSHETLLPEVLQGSVDEVAGNVIGTQIIRGESRVIISRVRPQDEEFNAPWINQQPIFGSYPEDAFVITSRSNPMLFIRTSETNSCIRITGAREVSTDRLLPSAKQVCSVLGITSPQVLDVVETEPGLLLVTD